MWNLAAPDCSDAESDLLLALKRASGDWDYEISIAEIADVLALYTFYTQQNGRPNVALAAPHLPSLLKGALHDAYEQVQQGGRLSKLRDRLKLAASLCPYCGFGEVRDLDHHLPRSQYEALAIFVQNLVPCCHYCNNKKRALASGKSREHFLHAYLESTPNENFFWASIHISSAGLRVTFSIKKTAGISEEMVARLHNQMTRLDLPSRLSRQANIFVLSLRPSIELLAKSAGSDGLAAFLKAAAAQYEKDFGVNDWRTALMIALSESDAFCGGAFKYCFGSEVGASA